MSLLIHQRGQDGCLMSGSHRYKEVFQTAKAESSLAKGYQEEEAGWEVSESISETTSIAQ